jgi:hypothetical protein
MTDGMGTYFDKPAICKFSDFACGHPRALRLAVVALISTLRGVHAEFRRRTGQAAQIPPSDGGTIVEFYL